MINYSCTPYNNPPTPGNSNPPVPGNPYTNPPTPGYVYFNPPTPGGVYYNPYTPGSDNYNPYVPGTYVGTNPATPGNPYYNPDTPGNAYYNPPTNTGNPAYNPTIPGNYAGYSYPEYMAVLYSTTTWNAALSPVPAPSYSVTYTHNNTTGQTYSHLEQYSYTSFVETRYALIYSDSFIVNSGPVNYGPPDPRFTGDGFVYTYYYAGGDYYNPPSGGNAIYNSPIPGNDYYNSPSGGNVVYNPAVIGNYVNTNQPTYNADVYHPVTPGDAIGTNPPTPGNLVPAGSPIPGNYGGVDFTLSHAIGNQTNTSYGEAYNCPSPYTFTPTGSNVTEYFNYTCVPFTNAPTPVAAYYNPPTPGNVIYAPPNTEYTTPGNMVPGFDVYNPSSPATVKYNQAVPSTVAYNANGNIVYNPSTGGNYAGTNPTIPGNIVYSGSTPGTDYYNPPTPGTAYYNPVIPGTAYTNPLVPAHSGTTVSVLGVSLLGGAIGHTAPITVLTPVKIPYTNSGVPIQVPPGGYVKIKNL